MATNTEICNAALREIGARRIPDISSAVGSAGIANDVLNYEREDLLNKHVWNFAVTRARLAALSIAPVFGFQYAYALPSDCLRVVEVTDSQDGFGSVRYKIESIQQDDSFIQIVATNANTIYLKYIRNVIDPNAMTAAFRKVLIYRLAKIFAVGIAASGTVRAQVDADLKSAMSEARSIDGIEDYPDKLPEGSWTTSRRAWGWSRNGNWPQ